MCKENWENWDKIVEKLHIREGRCMCHGVCRIICTGEKKDPRMFEVEENIFDLYRGDRLPVEQSHLVSAQVMEKMTVSLVNTSWAPSTRKLYHGWVLVWIMFCALVQAAALPACRHALARWIVSLSTMYATSTVHVAMSAIIGWHALNDIENPIRASPMLSRLWTAVRRVNGLGVRKKKAICDHAFVAGMYRLFRGMGSMYTWVQLRSMAWFLVGFEAGSMKQFRWLSEETPHVYTDMGDVEKNKIGAALHKAVGDSVRLASKLKAGDKGEDVACLVCGGKTSVAPNMIILCDGCPCGAHVKCLGLKTVPKGDWFCKACRHRTTSSSWNK